MTATMGPAGCCTQPLASKATARLPHRILVVFMACLLEAGGAEDHPAPPNYRLSRAETPIPAFCGIQRFGGCSKEELAAASGSGMNSVSLITAPNRPAFQSSLAWSMRSLELETKFH